MKCRRRRAGRCKGLGWRSVVGVGGEKGGKEEEPRKGGLDLVISDSRLIRPLGETADGKFSDQDSSLMKENNQGLKTYANFADRVDSKRAFFSRVQRPVGSVEGSSGATTGEGAGVECTGYSLVSFLLKGPLLNENQ